MYIVRPHPPSLRETIKQPKHFTSYLIIPFNSLNYARILRRALHMAKEDKMGQAHPENGPCYVFCVNHDVDR